MGRPPLYSQQMAIAIFEGLCEYNYNASDVCRRIGISQRVYWLWQRESVREKEKLEAGEIAEVDCKFIIRGWNPFDEDEPQWLHRLFGEIAKRVAALAADAHARASISPTMLRKPDGEPVLEFDLAAMAEITSHGFKPLSDKGRDLAAFIGYPHYPYQTEIDENGTPQFVPVMIDSSAATWRQFVMRNILPSWDIEERKTITQSVEHTGGVVVVSVDGQMEKPQAPKRMTLRDRLIAMRARGESPNAMVPPPKNPKPDSPVQIFGRDNDPPDDRLGQLPALPPPTLPVRLANPPPPPPPKTLADHPRAYWATPDGKPPKPKAPPPEPPRPPPPYARSPQQSEYARPDKGETIGPGKVPPNGMKTV